MSEFRWIKTSLFLILVLQFTAATGQLYLFITVRDGDEVTLPCNSVIDDHENCDSNEWLFTNSRRRPAVLLVRDGQIVKDKSDRLSVSKKCSLVIKNVTDEDVARYECRQLRSGQLLGADAEVRLSVVTSEYLHHDVFKLSCQNNILKHYNNHDYSDEVTLLSLTTSPSSPVTEHEVNDEVTLRCSVSTFLGRCVHRVKWLLQGQDVEEDNKDFKTSQAECSTSLTFLTSHLIYTSRFNSFKCEVTDYDKVQQFSFRNSLSGEKTGDDKITEITDTETEDDTTAGWWRFISVSVGLAALIIIVVAVNIRARIKEKKTQMDQIAVRYDGEDDSVTYENIRPPDGD
ncbi:uncharacterized protein LOC142942043 isoform X2 [Anarhichas minor]|uniref:uncharacterized protein LOC142942043 isoform X2 n=1 Tax=Anarhichas minor TaxID=65739 RepID=UPI003F733C7B